MSLDMDIINAAMVRQRSESDAAAANAANAALRKKTDLNQEDFLTLMITQLKNQDPMKPLDPSQYVGQLAQFSQVSGISDMNKQITSLTESLRGNQVLGGAGLIGRTVIAPGNSIYLGEVNGDQPRGPQGLVNVPAGASSVQLQVKDSSGALIRTVALDTSKGPQAFSWDGLTNTGAAAAAGAYKISVVAKVGNDNVSLDTSVAAHVSSVALDPSTGSLVLDTDSLGEVAMSDVQRVF
jgi:flagellar basal-body rod modification protein FlgD